MGKASMHGVQLSTNIQQNMLGFWIHTCTLVGHVALELHPKAVVAAVHNDRRRQGKCQGHRRVHRFGCVMERLAMAYRSAQTGATAGQTSSQNPDESNLK